jgi:hypothetical protein
MKATLFIIENDRDHAEAKALIEKLMGSDDAADQARMVAQARLIEAYERARWPRRTSLATGPPYLLDGAAWAFTGGSGATSRDTQSGERSVERQA